MMAALLPLRLWKTGSSCSTPSSERNPAAASPCIVWRDLAGKWLAASISINWQRTLVIVPEGAGVDIYIPAFSIQFCVWIWGMIVACEHVFPAGSCQAFSCTCDLVVFPDRWDMLGFTSICGVLFSRSAGVTSFAARNDYSQSCSSLRSHFDALMSFFPVL